MNKGREEQEDKNVEEQEQVRKQIQQEELLKTIRRRNEKAGASYLVYTKCSECDSMACVF